MKSWLPAGVAFLVAGVLGLVAVITSAPRPDGDPVGGAS
jgi:hypothetical protein